MGGGVVAASSIAAFWGVAAVLIVVPGADWAFILGAAARQRSVVPAVAGLVVGYLAVTAIVAAGVGAAVAGSPVVLTGLTVVGGLYLMWHGAMTLARPASPAVSTELSVGVGRGMLVKGIGVSGLNPKGLLIFLALLPQFTDTGQVLSVAEQIGVLGLVFTVSCAAFYLALGAFAQTVLRARPGAAQAVSRVAGVCMIAIGAALVVERLLG
jgi:threonine/homoserine/homoserine lactone efflux protein